MLWTVLYTIYFIYNIATLLHIDLFAFVEIISDGKAHIAETEVLIKLVDVTINIRSPIKAEAFE